LGFLFRVFFRVDPWLKSLATDQHGKNTGAGKVVSVGVSDRVVCNRFASECPAMFLSSPAVHRIAQIDSADGRDSCAAEPAFPPKGGTPTFGSPTTRRPARRSVEVFNMKWLSWLLPCVLIAGSALPAQAQLFSRKPRLNMQ